MEADQMIFKAILEPLIVDSVTEVFKKQCLDAQEASQNLVDEDFADTVIVAYNRFYKQVFIMLWIWSFIKLVLLCIHFDYVLY